MNLGGEEAIEVVAVDTEAEGDSEIVVEALDRRVAYPLAKSQVIESRSQVLSVIGVTKRGTNSRTVEDI
jgi:hypothetical protein